jgi:hypothetical protein
MNFSKKFNFIFIIFLLLSMSMLAQSGSSIDYHPSGINAKYGNTIHTRVPPPKGIDFGLRTAQFEVEYLGFTEEAQAAFQYAVDIWSSLLISEVVIKIEANWEDIPGNTLGYAFGDVLLQDGIIYPYALADKIAGVDLSEGEPDIYATFDSGTNWYYGTDGLTPFSDFDFVSVVLHEIGHGLGVTGSAYYGVDDNGYYWNGNMMFIYDYFVETGDSVNISSLSNGTSELAQALISEDLFWDGDIANSNSPLGRPRMYSPPWWIQGSSLSHLDESTYPSGDLNSLMTPSISNGEAVHSPGGIGLGILADIGWSVDFDALYGLYGCTDDTACNYDPAATFDDGTNCIYAVDFLDCDGNCLNDTDGDMVCDELETAGCTDMTACNYDDTVTDTDNTLCEYAETYYDCDGNCLIDTDGDGVCDELEIEGCIDDTACNYDDTATDSTDTCDFSCYGCTDMDATNYGMDATMDDNSCCYLVISLVATDALCYGGDGIITATSTGSTETVTYTLGEESNESGAFTVSAGTYTVTATDSDANMCTSSMEVIVVEAADIVITASATGDTGDGTGVGTATVEGGDGTYTYVWTDSEGNEVDPSAMADGVYVVTATDGNGCSGTAEVNVDDTYGLNDIDPLAFGLFPNPTQGLVTLQVSTLMEDVRMQVLDATGRVVFTQEYAVLHGATTFDFSSVVTGTYTIMISNDSGTSVRRIAIQN